MPEHQLEYNSPQNMGAGAQRWLNLCPVPYTQPPGSYILLHNAYMVQELFLGVKNSKNTKKENSWKSSVFAELSVWNFAEPNLKFGPNSSAEPVPNR